MSERWNDLQWDGKPGHYEVYYLTLTDPDSNVGFWIRYTMLAPLTGERGAPSCSLWLMAMDPQEPALNAGHKVSYPIDALSSSSDPFELRIGSAVLREDGMQGEFDDSGAYCSWDLTWQPHLPAYGHVHPALRAARLAKTTLFLPHPDIEVSGTIEYGGRKFAVTGARAGQAHLWGSKHAQRWAWGHCNDFVDDRGEPVRDTFLDAASVFVPRFGRTIGPNTPVVARLEGRDYLSTGPLAVARNRSEFGLTSWQFTADAARSRLVCKISARIDQLVGVTYQDPDGDAAYCYNSETASMDLRLYERDGRRGRWQLRRKYASAGHAHFEYAQREPVAGVSLAV